ncbi:hypothetical protein ACM66B_006192 [Microbotryomycetes sp. NB124-2]
MVRFASFVLIATTVALSVSAEPQPDVNDSRTLEPRSVESSSTLEPRTFGLLNGLLGGGGGISIGIGGGSWHHKHKDWHKIKAGRCPRDFRADGSGRDGFELDIHGRPCPTYLPSGWLYFGVDLGWAPPHGWRPHKHWHPSKFELDVCSKIAIWFVPPSYWVPSVDVDIKIPSIWFDLGWTHPHWPRKSWKCSGNGKDGWKVDWKGHGRPHGIPNGWLWFGMEIGWAPPKGWICPNGWSWIPATWKPNKCSWWAPPSTWVPPPTCKVCQPWWPKPHKPTHKPTSKPTTTKKPTPKPTKTNGGSKTKTVTKTVTKYPNPTGGGSLSSGRRLYIGRLPPDVTRDEVESFFEGKIVDIRMMQGFCFLEFETLEDAERAVADKHNADFKGNRLIVEYAMPPKPLRNPVGYGAGGYGGGRGGYGGGYDRPPPPPRRDFAPRGGRGGIKLKVSGLPSGTSWQDLKDFARQAGFVSSADVDRDDPTVGYVTYPDRRDADYALDKMDRTELHGSKVYIDEVRESRPPPRDDYRRDDYRERDERPRYDDREPRRDREYERPRSRSPPRRDSRSPR